MSHWFQRIPPPSHVHTASVLNASRLMFVFAHAMARATYTHKQTHTHAHFVEYSYGTQLCFLLA